MSLTAEALRVMASKGLTIQDAIEIAEAMSTRSANAERQARYRERHRNVTNNATRNASRVQDKETSPEPPKENPTPKAPSPLSGAHGSSAKPNGFDRFWEAYPRKVGKGLCRKLYPAALRQIGGDDPAADLLGALKRVRLRWRDLEPEFVPHPATWLRQGRWEDEPDEVATGPPRAVRDENFAAAAVLQFRQANNP